jgi:hypothetical protein
MDFISRLANIAQIFSVIWMLGRTPLTGERAQNRCHICAQYQMSSPLNDIVGEIKN